MRVLEAFSTPGQRATQLVVMLPGALQKPEDFIEAGFRAALRDSGAQIDLLLVDPGVDYIGDTTNGALLRQIDELVVGPARARGYRRITLGGISIGGLMAVNYADRYPGQIDALCLLSPYPGNRMITREIAAAGGLAGWNPGPTAAGDGERAMWRWLQANGARAPVHLGYGSEDRFVAGIALMAHALPPEAVDVIAGAHDWPTWQTLWQNFLGRSLSGAPEEMETLP